MNAKSAILMAAVAASANAYTISADQSKQLDIIFKDVMDNLMDYMNLVSDPSSGITADNLPAGLMDLGAAMAVDPSYVPDYSSVDIDAVSTFITKLTWFDSKLEPELEAAGVPMVVAATTAAPTTAAPAQTSAAASTPAATDAATTPAATTPAATDAATTPAATDAASTAADATTPAGETTAAAAQTSAAAPAVSVSVSAAASAPAPATNGTAGVETKFLTSTKLYHNTTVITSCPPESSTVVDITAKKTSTVTETVCDEACHSRKAAASAASTVTKKDTSTVTATVCDEACHSKKAAASSAAKKTSTVAQVTNAKTSSKPVIEQQTENGAIKAAAGMGAGVLAAAALLI
ncbi:cold shock-induced protein Tir1p [Monosporozyma servazzii]